MRIRVPRTSIMDILRRELFQLSSKSLVVHQPPCRLRGPQCFTAGDKITGGLVATSPLPSWGSPMHQGTNSEVVASPLPSRGPTRGRKCYITPAFSRVPKQGDKIRSGRLTLPSRGPTSGQKCYVTPTFSGVPKQGDKIRSGCLTLAFSWDKIRSGVSKKAYLAFFKKIVILVDFYFFGESKRVGRVAKKKVPRFFFFLKKSVFRLLFFWL